MPHEESQGEGEVYCRRDDNDDVMHMDLLSNWGWWEEFSSFLWVLVCNGCQFIRQ